MEDLEVDDYTTKSHKKQESVDEVIGSLECQLKVKARQTLKSSQGREYLNCDGQKIRKSPYIRPKLKKQSSYTKSTSSRMNQGTSSEAIAGELTGRGRKVEQVVMPCIPNRNRNSAYRYDLV